MTRGPRDHRVQHGDHAPANRRTQINMLFSSKYFPTITIGNSTSRISTLFIGVHSNTACQHGIYLQMTKQYCLSKMGKQYCCKHTV